MEEWRLDQERCPQHKGPLSDCAEPRPWYPQRVVCHATQAAEAANRQYDALHADQPYHDGTFTVWTAKPTDGTPFHYRDGVRIGVTKDDLNPHDHFLGESCEECQSSSSSGSGIGGDAEAR